MRNYRFGAGIALVLSSWVLADFAMADKSMSQGDLKAACDKNGGESFELSAGYGCIVSGGEKAVFCKKSDNSCTVVSRVSAAASRKFYVNFGEAAKK